MIRITLTETKNHIEIESKGHSTGTDEPCSRVSTTLDIIKVFLTRYIVASNRKNGYTYLKLIKSPLTEENLTSAILYLHDLSTLYPHHITITERGINDEDN